MKTILAKHSWVITCVGKGRHQWEQSGIGWLLLFEGRGGVFALISHNPLEPWICNLAILCESIAQGRCLSKFEPAFFVNLFFKTFPIHAMHWFLDCGPWGVLLQWPLPGVCMQEETRMQVMGGRMKKMFIKQFCFLLMGHRGALHHKQAGLSCCAVHSQSVSRVSNTWSGLTECGTLPGRRPPHPDQAVTGGPALFSLQTQCTFKTCCCSTVLAHWSRGPCCKVVWGMLREFDTYCRKEWFHEA